MYEEYLDRLHPRPILNLEFYRGEDQYSDGDIEDTIIKIIAENEPEHYIGAINQYFGWPVYYHLTSTRKNILNWYPFTENSDILEIGCGFGAITSLLCDRCRTVTAVELSKRRAVGTLLRCREKGNLEIIVGNLNDIQFLKKYDYITLIGVLEYQGRFTNTDNPYGDFLKKLKHLLKPSGKLLIGIENQYGLKYWCGAGEDHTGVPFDGMNQYQFTKEQGIRTFSKAALEKLIRQSGFLHTYFYYPQPDYKLPTTIYSEDYLPDNENMNNAEYYYVPDGNTLIADEKKIYRDVLDNNVFDFFANSFLVECSDSNEVGKTIFASMCNDRCEEYQLGTRILRTGTVEKYALTESGRAHIGQTVQNEESLRERGLHTLGSCLREGRLEVPFVKEKSLESIFVEACRNKNEETVMGIFRQLYKEIMKSSEIVSDQYNIIYSLLPDDEMNSYDYGPILKNGYLDMTLRNAFVKNGELYWYDQEWMLENIPAKYIIFRSIGTVYFSYPDLEDKIPIERLIHKCGLDKVWDKFVQLEKLFSGSVWDSLQTQESKFFAGVNPAGCAHNIKKLINQ